MIQQALKYSFSSAVITILSFVYFAVLLRFVNYTIAYVITFALGVTSQFFAQSLFVFRKKLIVWKLPIMFCIYIGQAIAVYAVLWSLINLADVSELMSFVLATFAAFPVTFLFNKLLIER